MRAIRLVFRSAFALSAGVALFASGARSTNAQLSPYARGGITAVHDLRGDFVAAGCGLRGGGGLGTINVAGISGAGVIKEAVLYWTILADGSMPEGANSISFNASSVLGDLVAATGSPCQSMEFSYVFRADVTPLVMGDGVYVISNALDSGDPDVAPVAEGASVVVIYSEPSLPNRDIVLNDGAALTNSNGASATTTLSGFQGSSPMIGASLAFIVADGESALTDTTSFQGVQLGIDSIDGSDPPGDIQYWDTDNYDVKNYVVSGATDVSAQIQQGTTNGDCMIWIASPFSVSSNLPEVDIVTDMLTPIVAQGDRLTMRVTATNNTNVDQRVFVNMNIYRKQGGFIQSILTNRGGTLPAFTSIQKTFERRIPTNVPPAFLNTPLYIVTTVTRPDQAYLDDDYCILYVQ